MKTSITVNNLIISDFGDFLNFHLMLTLPGDHFLLEDATSFLFSKPSLWG